MKLLEIADRQQLEALANSIKQKHDLEELELYPDSEGNIELSMIRVSKDAQRSGSGSSAMQDLINYADANDKLIWLSVADVNRQTGTTSRSRLEKFYRRFGFVSNKGRNKDFALSMYANMYRRPKK